LYRLQVAKSLKEQEQYVYPTAAAIQQQEIILFLIFVNGGWTLDAESLVKNTLAHDHLKI